jgi:histidinol-phosphate aminotransferase
LRYKPIFVRKTTNSILKLEPYVAGATLEEIMSIAKVSRDEVVKLSSNENPLGPSPKAVEAIRSAATKISLYPNARCEKLREAIATSLRDDFCSENVLVAAGSSEIFSFIVRAFSQPSYEVIFAHPSFQVYADAVVVDGRVPVRIILKAPRFELKPSDVEKRLTRRTAIIIITRPNNPTSRLVSIEDTQKICKLASNSIVVCDEAYIEFADDYRNVSAVNLIEKCENLLVTRTFSKAYGLADLRVGYVVGTAEAVNILFKIRPKWNNGELAQEAALAALNDKEHLTTTLETVRVGRAFLVDQLKGLGFTVTPNPQGNFIFARPSSITARELLSRLMKKGISIRGPPADWKANYLRISVGTMEQNQKLMLAIGSIIG